MSSVVAMCQVERVDSGSFVETGLPFGGWLGLEPSFRSFEYRLWRCQSRCDHSNSVQEDR